MKRIFVILGALITFLSSCSKEEYAIRDRNVTVSITSPSLGQSLKIGEVHKITWVGEETGENGYKVYLNWTNPNGSVSSELLGIAKTTDWYFKWKVASTINGKQINMKCCWISFLGIVNGSGFDGETFTMSP